MTNAAQKTPISLLQELCAQQGMTPDYKLMSVEGAVHAPTFMYRVQVNEVVATATGQSKKKAKHAAAKAVLERLLAKDGEFNQGFVSDGVTVNAETLNEIISEPAAAPPPDENAEDNPVGKLQEHCMKNRWQPPYYETENATGLPHEKIFTIMCYVEKHTTTGEGKSKRLAKRQAAAKMLERLNSLKNVSKEEEEIAMATREDEAVSDCSKIMSDSNESEPLFADVNPDLESVKINPDLQSLAVNYGMEHLAANTDLLSHALNPDMQPLAANPVMQPHATNPDMEPHVLNPDLQSFSLSNDNCETEILTNSLIRQSQFQQQLQSQQDNLPKKITRI